MLIYRELLIVAPFRSGTHYTAAVLRKSKYDVGHEAVRLKGTVSGPFCTYQGEGADVAYNDFCTEHHTCGETPSMYNFGKVWQQTRDPLKTIGSMRDALNGAVKRWMLRALQVPIGARMGTGDLSWAIEAFLTMSLRCEGIAQLRFKVEEFPWDMFKDQLGLTGELPDVSTQLARSKRTFRVFKPAAEVYASIQYPTWDDIKRCRPDLYDAVYALATRYGYV